jgi:hypothetical protein
MKWQVDEMTSWWNDKLMKWQVGEMTHWQKYLAPSSQGVKNDLIIQLWWTLSLVRSLISCSAYKIAQSGQFEELIKNELAYWGPVEWWHFLGSGYVLMTIGTDKGFIVDMASWQNSNLAKWLDNKNLDRN